MRKITAIICMALIAVCMNAQTTIQVGDFYYQIVSVPNKTVRIVRGATPYKGRIDIPATIDYSGRTFSVISFANAFNRNEDIISVHIPGTFEKIEAEAFDRCINLKEVRIDEGVKEIGDDAFRKTAITSIKLPASVKTICYECFAGCKRLRKVEMLGVETVSLSVFDGCALLKDLTFPSTLKKLSGLGGLAGCSSLRTVTFNSPVYWAGKVEKCPSIVQITSNTKTPKANAPFHTGTMDTKTTIAVPKGCMNIYASTSGWNNFLNMKETDNSIVKMPQTAKEINDLGNEYFDGSNGRAIDYAKAAECYRKAMEMGYAEAYFNMAYSKEFGLGMASDIEGAARLYTEAVKKGFDYERVYKHLERIKVEVPEVGKLNDSGTISKRIDVKSFRQEVQGCSCKIKSVECKGYEMTVYGTITSSRSITIWWPRTIYIKTKNGKKIQAVRASGIPFDPQKAVANEGQPIEFSLTFPMLPEGTTVFDIIESDNADSWKFLDIMLNEPIKKN